MYRVFGLEKQEAELSGNTLEIKLPRDTVRACGDPCKRSMSFSYKENIQGKQIIIFCTDGNTVTDRYIGKADKASKKSRKWVLKDAQSLPMTMKAYA